MDFKVGQTVKLVDKSGMVAEIGATAEVIKTNFDFYGSNLIDVVWKTNFGRQMNGGYSAYHFKPVLRKNQQLLFAFME